MAQCIMSTSGLFCCGTKDCGGGIAMDLKKLQLVGPDCGPVDMIARLGGAVRACYMLHLRPGLDVDTDEWPCLFMTGKL